jgi:hypothetical protein
VGAAFFEPLGDGRFRSTEHTAGPWTSESQHLGPPSALLVRELERLPGLAGSIARVTIEILGPVPVAELEVRASVERPGRSVELLAGEISAGGRTVVRARAWRMINSDSTPVAAGGPALSFGPPEDGTPLRRPDGWGPGYLDVMEWRAVKGSFVDPGPATVWVRQTVDLVAGEAPSGLQRLFTVADSGNGVSNRLHPAHWWFINTELTVHVHRIPIGEWICLDANTIIGPNGIGTAFSTLYDQEGPVGAGAQALLVRPR